MPISMSGMGSGIDTADMVKKLVEVERAPIYRLQQNQKEVAVENQALLELRKRAKALQDSLRVLSGFEAAFEQKSLESNPAGHIDGVANKKAAEGLHKIEVISLASSLRFASKDINLDGKVQAGRVGFDDKSANFKGGSLSEFRDFLNKNFSDLLTAKVVSVKEGENALVIDTKKTGYESLLKIDDADQVLAKLEMYNANAVVTPTPAPTNETDKTPDDHPNPEPSTKEISEKKLFKKEELKAEKQAVFETTPDGKSLILDKAQVQLNQLPTQNKDNVITSIQVKTEHTAPEPKNPQNEEAPPETKDEKVPTYIEDGPTNSVNIKGIELHTYTIGRERLKNDEKQETNEQNQTNVEPDYGVILHYANSQDTISLKDKEQNFLINPKEEVKTIEFFNNQGKTSFSDLTFNIKATKELPSPKDKEDKKGKPDKETKQDPQMAMFPHLIKPAKNARLKLDGVILERNTNTDIRDIIDGTSLNLLKALPNEEIDLRITPNNKKAIEQANDFVKAYNELLLYAQEASKTAQVSESGKFEEMKNEQGVLVTNATVRSLIQGLKIKVSNPYPAVRDPHYRTLASIGITTGDVGAKWEEISKGYLSIEETTLADAIANYPLAVKELFVLDSNSDNRADNGFAFTTEKFLDPYTRITGGVITAQVKNNEERLKQIARDIKKVEDHAKSYEAKLKQRFGYMESNVSKQKAVGNLIKQRLGNPD